MSIDSRSAARDQPASAASVRGNGAHPGDRRRTCVPCDIPPFCRTNYFTGRLLTEQDFTSEQRYLRDKMRLHYRTLHGWGVACGLRVKPHPYCPDLRLVVEPGVAIDACGYEIVVPREVEIDLPRPGAEPWPHPGSEQRPHHAHEPYYVCLEYAECGTDPMPAPFDECGCNAEQGRRPARICESFELTLRPGTPPRIEWCPDDCGAILHEALEPCPAPSQPECLPLAFLERYVPGAAVTEDMIDNRTFRPLLPSTRLHDRLLRCLLSKVSLQALTRVSAIGWTHAQEYACHDFVHFYTGHGRGGPAFEVTFDRPVRTECLRPRVFQAAITRFGGPGGAVLEIAPSTVWQSEDRRSFHLQVDRDYVHRELHGLWFDVYLTLHCNLVLDDEGRAVDGDLIARWAEGDYVVSPPTGDGVPGGRLESWIRVRP